MKKPITKPKQRAREKMIKKKGKGVVANSGKKKSIAEKSGTASARTLKTVVANLNRKDSAALKRIETKNWQLTRELEQKNRALKIEAALEKVRAASSAMVKTEELSSVVSVMYKQFELLKDSHAVGFELALCDEAKGELQFWSSSLSQKNLPECYTIQKASHPFFKKQWNAWKTKKDRLIITLDEPKYTEFCKFIFSQTDFKKFPNHVKKFIRSRKKDVFTHAWMKYGLLEAVGDEALADEGFSLLQRFAKVFEQTYTRFLDLQKAEAQAREAQIEAALERLRARSMAMHQSGELNEIVAVVYEQLSQLGFDSSSYLLRTREDRKEAFNTWLSFKEISTLPKGYYLPKLNNPIHKKILRAWDDQEEYKVIEFGGDEKRKYDNLLFTKTSWKEFPQKAKKAIRSMDYAVICFSSFRHVGLQAIGTEPLPDDKAEILVRFAKVFEQTYTRFLDLQKAEEQTREAEVELALERVRAKTMAMQKSEELRELVFEYYKQIHPFGFAKWGFEIKIAKEDKSGFYCWISPPGARVQPEGFNIPTLDHWVLKKYWSAYEQQIPITSIVQSGADKRKLAVLLLEKSDMKNLPEDVKRNIMKTEYVHFSVAAMRFGLLKAVDIEPVPEKDSAILQRFAKVFEQTYTRFLDLQKAEAQAREAQIEAALERLRSRTMAMQKTDELLEAAGLLYKELSNLGIACLTSGYVLMDKGEKIGWNYDSSPADGSIMPEPLGIPHTETKVMRSITASWKKQEPFTIIELNPGETIEHQTFIAERTPNFPYTAKELIAFSPERLVLHTFNFKEGYLLMINGQRLKSAAIEMMVRFAKVFQQTYTRFLDLQKAEAQAREAQIEVSLERVRARAMAMHKSEELGEAAVILFKEFRSLGIDQFVNCGYVIVDETNKKQHAWMTTPDGRFLEQIHLPLTGDPVLNERYKSWKKKESLFHQKITGKVYKDHFDFVLTSPDYGSVAMEEITRVEMPDPVIFYCGNFSAGYLHLICHSVLNADQESILARFTRVFDLTYKRFLDLQKAEAQAREARIEAALERIRSRTMAMHKSDELAEVASLLFQQIGELGIKVWTAGFNVWLNNDNAYQDWITSPKGGFIEPYIVDTTQFPVFIEVREAKQRGDDFFVQYVGGEMIKAMYGELSKFAPQQFEIMLHDGFEFPKHQYDHFVFGSTVSLMFITFEPLPEAHDIFRRFGKVFEQTYTRFLDLQKAEAQAREATIEAALERVRASAMAMHKSDDLRHVVAVVFKELELSLNIQICILLIFNAEATEIEWWSTGMVTDVLLPQSYKVPLADTIKDNKLVQRYLGALQHGLQYDVFELSGETKRSWDRYLFEHTELKQMPKETQEAMMSFECVFLSDAFMSHGTLEIAGPEPLPEDKGLILQRFAKVIDLTYRRVEDLQKAEAQAREAQIEAALEKVRSRSMAMHKSDELLDVVNTVFEKLRDLNLPIDAAAIFVFEKGGYEYWFATTASIYPTGMHLPTRGNQVVDDISNAREKQIDFFNKLYSFDDKNQFFHNIFENTDFRNIPDERKKFLLECESLSLSVALEKNSGIQLNSYSGKVLSPKEVDVLKRFTRVFEQAYTRFLDLQKAEAQAREAQIEAALERVRSRSMAMQHSGELNEVLTTMFAELSSLGLALARCVIWTFNIEDRSARWWAANPEEESGTESFLIPYTDHPTCNEYWKSWEEKRTRYFYELSGETKRTWDDYLFNHTDMARLPEPVKAGMKAPEKVLLYNSFRDFGVLFAVSLEPLSEENFDIIERFGKVFDQSYTRFKDIQQAEAREMEAVRQASLDRVRAEIASMRTAKDLERITPLIWKELNTLSVPFIRCGVFIMDEDLQIIHNFLSTPDGKAIASFQLPYDTPGFVANILKHWQEKKMFLDHWDENGMKNFAQVLVNQGIFTEPGQYLKTLPAEGLYLHMLPFLQGMLYVGNTSQLAPENLALLLSLAEAFSTAYARYEDFNKLEAAKQQVDKALVDLKQAQQQLVQSEKMASLGELTAGIAHEIQNPLNFVNNFSEVNEELLAEMKDELRNGKIDDALALADNVLENQKKINHHGKRADGIVKGMLQHSRSSSGVKEPTDINVLADEYLRLAFHGLRAKDKSFNAKFTTDFDPTIEAINVVPQEIGRVILNLINNAFYAVTEKQKKGLDGYEPAVTVITKNSGGQILISVKDNGNGIPDSIKEKIFQPFFTTKPTGQGTGLGLSLAFDIVTKGHGGTLNVKSEQGGGSEFIIQIPVTT